ncbi:uncharacterized protein LOC133454570 isoform X2 [Cololabis saira]|uniref:uncharacterized protein LOC133454570 isoform X2 n=1 Tax=Cololabis saira TaxID=129043 RepID=UPI002AD4F106|nr:uncharacterized protein LOC133454570 isoform X2 [Cololabis saira]
MNEEEEDVDALGEQLYSLIYPKHTDNAGKLTGMLLELPVPVLMQMLQDEAVLSSALEKAVTALQLAHDGSEGSCKDEDEVSASSDSLGEQLFDLVDVYNTGHSQKITGMLLEQHKDAVLHLLSDPKHLEEQNVEEVDVSDSSELMMQTGWEKSSSPGGRDGSS